MRLGIFLPSEPFFWAINIGSNGAGNPDIQIQYSDVSNPNDDAGNGREGLTAKGVLTALRIEQGDDGDEGFDLFSGVLGDFTGTGQTIDDKPDLVNGYARLLVGLSAGEVDDEGDPVIAGAEPFTALDEPGNFSGQLTLTATFDND